jgi:hypothetical protein
MLVRQREMIKYSGRERGGDDTVGRGQAGSPGSDGASPYLPASKLRCLGDQHLLPIRRSDGSVLPGVVQMSERLQIEGPKFGHLTNKPLSTSTD